jgi:hypothetical protein
MCRACRVMPPRSDASGVPWERRAWRRYSRRKRFANPRCCRLPTERTCVVGPKQSRTCSTLRLEGKAEDHDLQRVDGRRAVVPQIGVVRLALAGLEHLDRSLSRMQERLLAIFSVKASTGTCRCPPHSPTHSARVARAVLWPARPKMCSGWYQRHMVLILGSWSALQKRILQSRHS